MNSLQTWLEAIGKGESEEEKQLAVATERYSKGVEYLDSVVEAKSDSVEENNPVVEEITE